MLAALTRLLRRRLPRSMFPLARRARAMALQVAPYDARVASETATYDACTDVHDLPPIFHYWSNRYLRPKLETFGFAHPDAFFAKHATACYDAGTGGRRFVSVGAGNCDTEIRLAQALVAAGRSDFVLECLDLNEAMLARGRDAARAAGLERQLAPLRADLNRWRPSVRYDAVLANQSLHHVLELEHLFDAVGTALLPHGRFIVSDMIGRNGHQRWPEARAIVDEFWRELPVHYRYNRQLQRQETEFLDWDCSAEGFEGIRAQDILPLLVERFAFDLFIGFANVIDPFVDRAFGHHFDADAEWDRAFIDRVHARDDAEMLAGTITPTHMLAVLGTQSGANLHLPGLAPRNCIRDPGGRQRRAAGSGTGHAP